MTGGFTSSRLSGRDNAQGYHQKAAGAGIFQGYILRQLQECFLPGPREPVSDGLEPEKANRGRWLPRSHRGRLGTADLEEDTPQARCARTLPRDNLDRGRGEGVLVQYQRPSGSFGACTRACGPASGAIS